MATPDVRADRWVFTINNYTEIDIAQAMEFLESTVVRTGVMEKEIGESGTPHLQGYFTTDKKYHRSVMAHNLPRAFLEPAMGGWKQNWKYCTKEGGDNILIEKGHTLSEKDKLDQSKERFLELYGKMKQMTPLQFEEENPQFMFYHRNQVLQVMLSHADVSSVWDGDLKRKNYWVWGKTGTGKTSWAYMMARNHCIYRKGVQKWWSGFDVFKHDVVIVDEWPAVTQGLSDAMCSHLKNWSDRYSFAAETKGGHVTIHPGRFILIVTSQYPISECFTNPEDILALQRRFHCYEFRFTRDPQENYRNRLEYWDEDGSLIEHMASVDWDCIDKTPLGL